MAGNDSDVIPTVSLSVLLECLNFEWQFVINCNHSFHSSLSNRYVQGLRMHPKSVSKFSQFRILSEICIIYLAVALLIGHLLIGEVLIYDSTMSMQLEKTKRKGAYR